jgi:hypothetical protein
VKRRPCYESDEQLKIVSQDDSAVLIHRSSIYAVITRREVGRSLKKPRVAPGSQLSLGFNCSKSSGYSLGLEYLQPFV